MTEGLQETAFSKLLTSIRATKFRVECGIITAANAYGAIFPPDSGTVRTFNGIPQEGPYEIFDGMVRGLPLSVQEKLLTRYEKGHAKNRERYDRTGEEKYLGRAQYDGRRVVILRRRMEGSVTLSPEAQPQR